jgi:uncharacterized phage protein (TIGR01671 family)
MNREIRFRGISKETGNFIYGYLVGIQNDKLAIKDTTYNLNNGKINLIPTEIVEGTESQFTGLKDKAGVDIYESDICKFYNKYNQTWYTRVVRYCPHLACFGLYPNMEEVWQYESDWLKISEVEVIGNLYQNPELLNPSTP